MVKAARLTPELLVERYPRLWHMAEHGSWESIRKRGLLSTSALLDLFGIKGRHRRAIEERRRVESIRIDHPVHGVAWLRGNRPINDTVLRRTLVGVEEADYYRMLNGRVFFWVSEARLKKLRGAPPYRDRVHDIIAVDTARLLERYADQVELSHLNSGAVHAAANYPRGLGTFQPIDRYPWAERRALSTEPLVELTVTYSVPDIVELIDSVTAR